MNFLNLTDTSMPLEAVKLELARYCSTPWNQVGHIQFPWSWSRSRSRSPLMLSPPQQIRQQHPGVKVKYLAAYCFSGTYIITLLTEGYNFSSESYSSIRFIKKVGVWEGGSRLPTRITAERQGSLQHGSDHSDPGCVCACVCGLWLRHRAGQHRKCSRRAQFCQE